MMTLGALGGLSATFMGGSAAKKTQGPPINAQSPDEESFIRYVPGEINCSFIHKAMKGIS
jgi:hypothetical protein